MACLIASLKAVHSMRLHVTTRGIGPLGRRSLQDGCEQPSLRLEGREDSNVTCLQPVPQERIHDCGNC